MHALCHSTLIFELFSLNNMNLNRRKNHFQYNHSIFSSNVHVAGFYKQDITTTNSKMDTYHMKILVVVICILWLIGNIWILLMVYPKLHRPHLHISFNQTIELVHNLTHETKN